MEKIELIFSICFVSLLLILLIGFLFFMALWQRKKSNKFIREREAMKVQFNEQLLTSQLEMQEQSFNTISMEIHDNVGQTLSLLKVQLNIIEQQKTLDKILLAEAKSNVGQVMTDLRDIAKSLSTERVQNSSLSEMTEHELQRISRTGIMEVSLGVAGVEQTLKEGKKLILFRIIQESLQNIIKHSHATCVKVSFINSTENLKIEIIDNGRGFNIELLNGKSYGLGLQNIVNRAAVIGGHAKITSAINLGTTITIITPYD